MEWIYYFRSQINILFYTVLRRMRLLLFIYSTFDSSKNIIFHFAHCVIITIIIIFFNFISHSVHKYQRISEYDDDMVYTKKRKKDMIHRIENSTIRGTSNYYYYYVS